MNHDKFVSIYRDVYKFHIFNCTRKIHEIELGAPCRFMLPGKLPDFTFCINTNKLLLQDVTSDKNKPVRESHPMQNRFAGVVLRISTKYETIISIFPLLRLIVI